MTIVDNLFGQAEAKLEIGDLKFEIVQPISGIAELDAQKDDAEFKRDLVKVIAWFVDDRWFGNPDRWNQTGLKEDKFLAFIRMVRKNQVQPIYHIGLNTMGFNYGKIRRVETEFRKTVIVVSFDLEQYRNLEDKKKKRQQITLADPKKIETTVKAAEAKLNAAQKDQEESNAFLDNLNNLFKKLFEKLE